MKKLLVVLMVLFIGIASAQGTKTVAVRVSNQTQMLNNKEYYFHIVEQGQTVFSIARAYGLKYYDAVLKTDIHLMKVGDTVWLPKNEYSDAAVASNAAAEVVNNSTHYIKIDAGQTLYSIAREYGVTVDAIVEANPELRTEQLKAGQMLKIPPRNDKDKSTLERQRAEEEQRLAEEAKRQEEQRLAEEAKRQEEQRLAEERRQEEMNRKQAEEKKRADEQRRLEEKRRAEEQKLMEEKKATTSTAAEVGTIPQAGELMLDSASLPVMRPVVNPYPFDEMPSDFPLTQAPYYNFSTQSTFNYQVRDRQDKQRLFITVVMPLNLAKINEISTSKFDIEQRGKKEYKVFEFVQFYEGILMALDKLQGRGLDIVLNVVDLTSDKDEDVEAAFYSHNVANSDFIIALLVKKPFNKMAELARQNQVFVINPFSSRVDVVNDNPYVVKYMPSTEGTVKAMLDIVARKHRNGHLYLVHSNAKSNVSGEKEYFDEFQKQLSQRKDIQYTTFDWAANSKLVTTLKGTADNVIISIYDQGSNKNTVFSTTLLNRLSSLNTNVPVLMTVTNYLTEFPNVDFDQLQHLNYTTVTTGYLDYNNPKHKEFIDTYKDKFRTEPNTLYAGVAYDIMLYFSTALWQNGAEFWRNPQHFTSPYGLLFPFSLKQSSPTGGYENQSPDIYQMQNYKLIPMN